MDLSKDYNRTRVPFNKQVPVRPDVREILLNNYGNVRAVLENGVISIQTKKLKGDQREIIRIDTNKKPVTLEFIIEE